MALRQTSVNDMAETILGCVCAALDAAADDVEGIPGCPCRACVVPGMPAWDDCEDPCGQSGAGGQLTVSFVRLYTSTTFPADDLPVRGLPGCVPSAGVAAEFVVTLLRCVPISSEDGCPPTCEEQSAAAKILNTDAVTVYNALVCCLPKTGGRRGPKYVMGQQKVVGPQGGCAGIEQRVTVALASCVKCPDEESP